MAIESKEQLFYNILNENKKVALFDKLLKE